MIAMPMHIYKYFSLFLVWYPKVRLVVLAYNNNTYVGEKQQQDNTKFTIK